MSTKWNPAKLRNKITIKWMFSSQGVYTHRIWTIFSSDLRDIWIWNSRSKKFKIEFMYW